MKEINDIKATDLKALAQLDKDCIDLHLFPPPKTFIQMEVEGPDGTKVESRKVRSQSWVRNTYNMMMLGLLGVNFNAAGSGFGPGMLGLKNTSSGRMDHAGALTVGTVVAGAGVTDFGIVAGCQAGDERFDDFNLFGAIGNGTTLAPAVANLDLAAASSRTAFMSASADGKKVATCNSSSAPFVYLFSYDPDTKRAVPMGVGGLPAVGCNCLNWSPCGNYLAHHPSAISTVKLFKHENGSFVEVHSEVASGTCRGAWSLDGEWYFVATGNPFLLKNNRNGTFTKFALTNGITGWVEGVPIWSPDGRHVLLEMNSAPYFRVLRNNGDGTMTALTVNITNAPASAPGFGCFSPDGKYFISCYAGTLYYFKKTGLDSYAQFVPSVSGLSSIYRLAWSKDGSYFVAHASPRTAHRVINNNDDTFVVSGSGLTIAAGSTNFLMSNIAWDGFMGCSFDGSPKIFYFELAQQLSYAAQEGITINYDPATQKQTFVLRRVMNNNGAVNSVVREVGLIGSPGGGRILLSRDIFPDPVVVPPAYKLTVTYTMEMTFPA